jgi:hypothetical protein
VNQGKPKPQGREKGSKAGTHSTSKILHMPTGPQWNDTIRTLPNAHIFQTAEWGVIKQRQTNWKPEEIYFRDQLGNVAGAMMVLTRRYGPCAVMYDVCSQRPYARFWRSIAA